MLDEHGEAFHKSKGNSIEFIEAVDKIGVDVRTQTGGRYQKERFYRSLQTSGCESCDSGSQRMPDHMHHADFIHLKARYDCLNHCAYRGISAPWRLPMPRKVDGKNRSFISKRLR
jgi:hypothetical protein